MEKLERRMRQALIKVDERVARISKMAVVEKSKKMLQKLIEADRRKGSKKAEKPPAAVKMLQLVHERVRNALFHALRLVPLSCLRDDGHGEVSFPASASASQRTETEDVGGDSPRRDLELDAVPRPRALWMDMASCYIPDHDEDAFFCHPAAGVIAVADGVGGYRKRGVDAGAFARALIASAFAEARRAFAAEGSGAPVPVCPYALLRGAHEAAARSLAPGASTAAVVSLDGATLRWACVGDSGFAVLRGGRIVHRSTPQQHRFNCPYQLSAADGGDSVAADADVGGVPVVAGDVVVVGTDGLFDNVFDVELERLVREGTELGMSPQDMADDIAGTALQVSLGWLAHSPSSTCSTESWRKDEDGVERFYSGKVDDITVVVAFIVSSI
ncbi:unnamed protein product [Urochloa decumbens]|uniref:Protein phosphatase n=1 Tax=Urochloa decumbens TaxID=240449 RepID=A0ABC9EHA2_9POAL